MVLSRIEPKPAPLRSAAAVLLFRGSAPDSEVYLVDRARELRFLGGYSAFPGGVVDPGETAAEAAVRELFEETGVLPSSGPWLGEVERRELRRALLSGKTEAWRDQAGDVPEVPLQPICRVVTPPFAPVRYDTQFFACELPQHEQPEVWPGELSAGRFLAPAAALLRWRAGELALAPPVLLLLELLAEHGRDGFAAPAAALAATYDNGTLPRMRFSPGVVMASLRTPTLPPATTTNSYLVGGATFYAIDPAPPDADEQERLFALVEGEIRLGGRLGAVLLTHHHPDHVGAAASLARRFGVAIRAHARTLERLPSDWPLGAPLAEGDALELGAAPDGRADWKLRALFTPGHAQGHLAFVESRYGALFAGDLVSTVSTIVIDPPEGHMATYLASLARVRDLAIGTLYPAHGPPALFGRSAVERLLRHRAEREAKLAAALAAGATTEAELLPRVYDDVDARILPIAARSLVAGLEKLAEEGRAVRAGSAWRASAR